jgi:hypothetical protein
LKQEISLKEMIAHRPLVIAWVWEMLCIAFAVYAIAFMGDETLFMGAIFAGVIPFVTVFMFFIQARKKASEGPDRSKDLVQ